MELNVGDDVIRSMACICRLHVRTDSDSNGSKIHKTR